MRILVSGAGIAGPTLAYWLGHYGFETTIVEKAPQLRTGGYVLDFWGLGFDIAERMGLLPEIRQKGYMVREVRTAKCAWESRRVRGTRGRVTLLGDAAFCVSLLAGQGSALAMTAALQALSKM